MSQPVGSKYWQGVSMLPSPLLGPGMLCPYNGHLWATFTWDGTPTGLLALEVRVNSGPWVAVPGSAVEFTTQPSGAPMATPMLCNWVNLPGDQFRFTYTGAGAGTITAHVGFGDVQESF